MTDYNLLYKLNQAISDTYKPKAWANDVNDVHTAMLVLRIGGPRFLHVLAQQNMLASS